MNKKKIKNIIKLNLSKSRYEHSLRVARLCKIIAKNNNINPNKAWLAGICHDVAKEFNKFDIESLCGKKQSKNGDLHALAGSIYTKKFLSINDLQIINAIKHHTHSTMHPSKLSMCLYCADKIDNFKKNNINISGMKFIDFEKMATRKLNNAYKKIFNFISKKYGIK